MCLHLPTHILLPPKSTQESADDEHTTRGMRLVHSEVDAISKGWPMGDGIGLFGVGSSRSGLPGAGGASGKQRGSGAVGEQSVELNARASPGKAGGSSELAAPQQQAVGRGPLFGGGSSSAGGGTSGSSSTAAAMREKYGNRSNGSLAGDAAAAAPAAAGPSTRRQQVEDDGAVDALFARVEGRPARQTGTTRLLDQPADSAGSSYAMPFNWKRGR